MANKGNIVLSAQMITNSIGDSVHFAISVLPKIMKASLKNKVVIVAGGAQGIGYGVADKFLLHDTKAVIILDIDEIQGAKANKNLTDKHGEGKVKFIKCDVTTDLDQVSKVIIDTYKTVDVLVLSVSTPSLTDTRKMIDIYLTAVVEWSMKFQEHMSKDNAGNGGTIMLLSSIFGFRSSPYVPVYHAAKFGVIGFTKSLGHIENFKKTEVRVLALCPGFTETAMTLNLRDPELQKTLPEDMVEFANSFPWQKIEDVGKAAVEVYTRADSGTVWLIEGGEPITQIP